jgi:hypothetical protein
MFNSLYLMLILDKAGIEPSLNFSAESCNLLSQEEWLESQAKAVALGIFILQMLNPAQTLELTIDHNPEAGTEGLAFLHAAIKPNSLFTPPTIPRTNSVRVLLELEGVPVRGENNGLASISN